MTATPAAKARVPRRMRAAVHAGRGRLEVRELPVPAPGPGEVLVAVDYCGVCGTDVHALADGWAPPGTVGGHEWSGTVARVGTGVTGWDAGAAVVGAAAACGSCRWCRDGRPALCAVDPLRTGGGGGGGAFAEYRLAAASALRAVPTGLDQRRAAVAEPLTVALHALTRAGLREAATARTLVSGGGPLGLLVVAAARHHLGVNDLTVSEPSARRRERALAAGAGVALDPADLPRPPAEPTRCHPEGYDVVVECSGRAEAIVAAYGLLGAGGRLVLVGTGSRSVRLDPIRMLVNELVLTGAYCYDAGGFDEALALLAGGRLPLDALVEPADVTLDGLARAIERLAAHEIPAKVMVRP